MTNEQESVTERICAYCARAIRSLVHVGTSGQWEHVVPRIRGGPDTDRNLVRSCLPCNATKKDRTPSEWLASWKPPRFAMPENILIRERDVLTSHHILPRLAARTFTPIVAKESLPDALLWTFRCGHRALVKVTRSTGTYTTEKRRATCIPCAYQLRGVTSFAFEPPYYGLLEVFQAQGVRALP